MRVPAAALLTLMLGGAAPVTVQPGGWTHSMTIHTATIPGIPGFLIPKGRPKYYKTCLSPRDAAANPGLILRGEGMECTPRTLTMTNGKIASVATCTDNRLGIPMNVVSAGSYTPTSYELRSVSTGTRNGKPMRVETTSTGKLTHRC
jgi:hypothetical protein